MNYRQERKRFDLTYKGGHRYKSVVLMCTWSEQAETVRQRSLAIFATEHFFMGRSVMNMQNRCVGRRTDHPRWNLDEHLCSFVSIYALVTYLFRKITKEARKSYLNWPTCFFGLALTRIAAYIILALLTIIAVCDGKIAHSSLVTLSTFSISTFFYFQNFVEKYCQLSYFR